MSLGMIIQEVVIVVAAILIFSFVAYVIIGALILPGEHSIVCGVSLPWEKEEKKAAKAEAKRLQKEQRERQKWWVQ